jgi:hypothetical protein
MLNLLRFKLLQRAVASAINVVTKTIRELEKANAQYQSLREDLEVEIVTAQELHSEVGAKIKANNKLISNFKSLLS